MTATTDTHESSLEAAPSPARLPHPRRLRFGRRLLLVVPAPADLAVGFELPHALHESFMAGIIALADHPEVAASMRVIRADAAEIDVEQLPTHRPFDTVCALCADTPHLPVAFLAEAFARLEHPSIDTVCVPTDNGNYCLAGFKTALWDQLPPMLWERPETLQRAVETAQTLGARIATLPAWYRIQTDADLEKLRRDISRGTVTLRGTAAVLGL